MQIDPNGIAQGYSVDLLASLLESCGIQNYMVEVGGELRVKGRKLPSNERMLIGIESPGDDPMDPVINQVIALENGAITTSGNYRRYQESNGTRFTHLLDPRTGYSLNNELISVTVVAPDAITADAYDNALMAMGLKKALEFVEARPELAAYFIYKRSDGEIADSASSRFKPLLVNTEK
ncbi:MAG: FAD:protein FMN transferase [Chitinophagaceae bacterium]|nr:FAD:protein FMN transferase [Chitinophagaceae bacterium]